MTKWAIGIITIVLLLAGLVYYIYEKKDYDFDEKNKTYEIVNKWNLPNALDEISGMVWLGNNRIACVQDEDGIIFTFDLNSGKITQETKFSGPGDYEAFTKLDDHYWVAESDGKLFRIGNINNSESPSEERKLEFEYKNNIEGIAADPDGNLIIAVKDRNLKKGDGSYKGIYSYNPVANLLETKPRYRIAYSDEAFTKLHTVDPEKLIRPSDIAFHPQTGELYVLDAEIQKLLILENSGKIKRIHLFDPAEFFQPEGICFDPSGRLFISNEGKGGDANILEVRLK